VMSVVGGAAFRANLIFAKGVVRWNL
jgi:hypothetical protein